MDNANSIRNLATPAQRAMYFSMSHRFEVASADEATRHCKTLGECASLLPLLIADAYLMGGEL